MIFINEYSIYDIFPTIIVNMIINIVHSNNQYLYTSIHRNIRHIINYNTNVHQCQYKSYL
jgi:hypothetical protein